jgi:hypothetical protein
MQINELWNYLLSFTIYGTDEYMHYKIIATLFLIGGVYIFLDGLKKPFLLNIIVIQENILRNRG